MMMVAARKVEHLEPFKEPPQQSDYVTAWSETAARGPSTRSAGLRLGLKKLYRSLPESLLQRFEGLRERRQFSLSNRDFYRKL